MTSLQRPLTAVLDPDDPVSAPVDPRVAAVLRVLAGEPSARVARSAHVEPVLLHRWVEAFLDAGTAVVTNSPDDRVAAQRDRFLAAFAHELRTPMTVALGWVHMLADEDLGSPLAHVVDRLQDALDRLHDRTRDVELLAAASLGRLPVAKQTVRVADLVDGLPGLTRVGGEGDGVALDVDVELFRRVLRDLWHAASMEPTPRALRLEVHTVGTWTEIRAVREADPIEPMVLQALFEPFDVNDDATGVTIGLYLARALLVAHGGTLGIEQDENQAVVWVRVPRPAPGSRQSAGPLTQEVPRP